MKAVDTRLVAAKLVNDRREEIYHMFQAAVNTLNKQSFDELELKLCAVGKLT